MTEVVLQVGGAEIDVRIEAPADGTVADLVDALAGGPVASGTGLVVDGRLLAPGTPLARAGIVRGATVRLASDPPATAPAAAAVAELRVVGGLCAGARLELGPGACDVGRAADVRIAHPTVSARHARLHVGADGRCEVEDLGSTNGTRVDGAFVTRRTRVAPGQLLELGAVQARVVPRSARRPAGAHAVPGRLPGTVTFNRPPRPTPAAGSAPLTVPAPPADPLPAARFSWAMVLAPLALGAVMAVVFEPLMAAFAVFGPVMAVGTWWEDRRRVRRDRERNRLELDEAVRRFRSDLARAEAAEAARRERALPDPAETLARAARTDQRVWERRLGAPDVLRLSLGRADVEWEPATRAGAGEVLPEVTAALAEVGPLARSPVDVDLGPGRVLGVTGPPEAAAALARSLVCQAAVHHGPADVRVGVLADEEGAARWDWAKWLPHTAGVCAAGRAGADAVAAAWHPSGGGPLLLAVVDGDGFTEGHHAPVRDLLATRAVAAIVVVPAVQRLPASCTTVVEIDDADGVARVTDVATAAVTAGVLVAGVEVAAARACARSLARLDDPEVADAAAALPPAVPLVSLLGLGAPTAEELARRWAEASTATALAAPVGVGERGPLVVDLVADGPHALLAGTTGSGKSELLRALVASLATRYGPDRLTFVLVDYKGGSAFAECARLPHVVGSVTDLDAHLAERALRSLEAELRHREEVLARAGAADLAEHLSSGGGGPVDPLPRLVVLVDEFATLAAELPDFVDSLVDIAQRGRSLGVHLVLATQRPSGAVSDTIRANTNLRVALRVQDVPDSTDVVGVADAARVERDRPGRGYARLGHAEVVAFQAALVSTVSGAGDAGRVRARPFVLVPDAGPDRAAGPGPGEGPTDLARIVDAAVAAARAAGAGSPRRPWLEPLPATLLLDDLPPGAVGLADEPERQRQVPYRWDPSRGNLLVYGVAGSGTTTALASLALALVADPSAPVHLYVLDFGHGALAPLAGLPQVGAVVAAGERERQERLVRTLRAELERRRLAVASGRPDPWPALVLLVDNLGGFWAAFDDLPGMAVRDHVVRLLADGPALGVVVAATADRPGAVPVALSSLAPERLLLRLADPYDRALFGVPAAVGGRPGPGRAIEVGTHREVQLAVPAPGGLGGLPAAVARAASAPRSPSFVSPPPIAVLPARVAFDALTAARPSGPEWDIPIGIGDAALRPVGLRLGEGDHALVAGPARCGKSTLLCTVAEAVARSGTAVTTTAVALRRSPLREAGGVAGLVTHDAELGPALDAVLAGAGPQLLLVDDAELVDDPGGALAAVFAARRPDLHVVAAGRADALRGAYGHWVAQVRRSRSGVALRPHLDLDGDLWHTVLPRHGPDRFPPGRGYLITEGHPELVQAAVPDGAPAAAGSRGGA